MCPQCAEVLFQLNFIGEEASRFLDILFFQMKRDADIRNILYAYVVSSGGTTMFSVTGDHSLISRLVEKFRHFSEVKARLTDSQIELFDWGASGRDQERFDRKMLTNLWLRSDLNLFERKQVLDGSTTCRKPSSQRRPLA